jgi:hypothetical protein
VYRRQGRSFVPKNAVEALATSLVSRDSLLGHQYSLGALILWARAKAAIV